MRSSRLSRLQRGCCIVVTSAIAIAVGAIAGEPTAGAADNTNRLVADATNAVSDLPGVVAGSKTVSLPSVASDPVVLDTGNASLKITATQPQGSQALKTLDNGTKLYGQDDNTILAVQGLDDGGVRQLTVLDNSQSPERFSYAFASRGGAHLGLDKAGGVIVTDDAGTQIAYINPAWASDANGASVPTEYELSGSTLTQVVHHRSSNVAYPVVADPNTCGWITCTYYFGKLATADIAGASSATAACVLLAEIPVLATYCALQWSSLVVQANRAKNRGMCLKIKYGVTAAAIPDIYKGKYCK